MAEPSFSCIKIQPNTPIKPAIKEQKLLEKILGKKVRNQSNESVEFQNIRFLTGERLQPMHKMKKFRYNRTRPSTRALSTESAANKKNNGFLKKENNIGEYNHNLMKIGNHNNHQEKIDSFDNKFVPLKQSFCY